jgi:hypothetical protein
VSRLGRWSVTVLTMVSVATVLLLLTGWGSAVAANVSSVLVTNRPSNPVPVQQQGTADVKVTNTTPMSVKSGDVASVLGQGGAVAVSPGQRLTLNPDAMDVGAYREVTLYLEFVGGDFNTDTELSALTDDGTPFLFAFDDLDPQGLRVVKTYDPAPTKLVLQLWNHSTTSETDIDYTIVGRTN